MINLLMSTIGIISVNRIAQRFQKFLMLNDLIYKKVYALLLCPIYISQFFKEPYLLIAIYIGVIFFFLILESTIFEKKLRKTYETMHIELLNRLIFQMKSGFSAQSSIKECFESLNSIEKIVFSSLQTVYLDSYKQKSISDWSFSAKFNDRIVEIMSLNAKVVDHLCSFRDFLKIQKRFKDKFDTATAPLYIQAVICGLVYVVLMLISVFQFDLLNHIAVIFMSLSLFIVGQYFVFRIGRKVKWKI